LAGDFSLRFKNKGLQMTASMLDQILFDLSCGHTVVLGRLEHKASWTCEREDCGKKTDLTEGPYKATLAHDLDTASQIDLQEKARGVVVKRLG
jgi:hypothetical protein